MQVKYQLDSEEHTRFIYRDKNDWLHDKMKVRVHPKTGYVARSGLRRTYYNCSEFTKNSIRIMSGIGWGIDIGIFVSYHLTMGEQKKIDKHSFTL